LGVWGKRSKVKIVRQAFSEEVVLDLNCEQEEASRVTFEARYFMEREWELQRPGIQNKITVL
jgi:hypothetical protein